MCGIVGLVSSVNRVGERILNSIKRLEYRGYDSAGLATIDDGKFNLLKVVSKVKELEVLFQKTPIDGHIGIGHTRWATHGAPTYNNAHPLVGENVCIVHNGIIENYLELKQKLLQAGYSFEGDTDTEVLAKLFAHYLREGKTSLEVAKQLIKECTGLYAFVAMVLDQPDTLIGLKNGLPLALGFGEDEMYFGSDAFALFPLTNKLCYLEDGEVAIITSNSYHIYNSEGTEVKREAKLITIQDAEGKQNFQHFMLKEIYEQPKGAATVFDKYFNINNKHLNFPDLNIEWNEVSRVIIIACGTSYYSACVAKYWIEEFCRLPAEVEIASEFRYRNPVIVDNALFIFVSQSGETADTLSALKYVKEKSYKTIAIVNIEESSIANLADYKLFIYAGVEIGVASTKCFTNQMMVFGLLSLHIAHSRGVINDITLEKKLLTLHEVSGKISEVLSLDNQVKDLMKEMVIAKQIICIGRGVSFPVALEAALKIKEITYLPSEGVPGGELKHGPIAMIDSETPVFAIAPYNETFSKIASNVQEINARAGKIILLSNKKGCEELKHLCHYTFVLPEMSDDFTSPFVNVVIMQLVAYHLAVLKGCDVDQPRNLAKTVTVE